jgi:hypothetical protein
MTNEQLQSFLLFAVSADENAAQILSMDACNYLLRRAENTEFVPFQDGETNINKVQLLLDMFDSLKNNRVLCPLILNWMNEAVGESLYSVPDDDSLTYSSISSKPSSDEAVGESLYSVPDDDSLTYSSISSKPSSDADSQASQIATVDTDVAKVKEFGRVIALLEVDEIDEQLKVMNIRWETMPGTWKTAQVLINEIIRKIEALELGYENSLLRTKAIASFQEETDFQERVRFLRLALRENTTGAVLADSIADESGSTHASSPENGRGASTNYT